MDDRATGPAGAYPSRPRHAGFREPVAGAAAQGVSAAASANRYPDSCSWTGGTTQLEAIDFDHHGIDLAVLLRTSAQAELAGLT